MILCRWISRRCKRGKSCDASILEENDVSKYLQRNITLRRHLKPTAQVGNLVAQDILELKHIIWTGKIQDTKI